MESLIKLEFIDPNPWQPRLSEDAEHIANLAVSIADDGLMQVPTGRLMPDGRVQLAFGHSRLAAYRLLADLQMKLAAGTPIDFDDDTALARAVAAADCALELGTSFGEMPVHLVELDDESMYRFAVSENVQRRDLTPIEQAKAMARYRDEFGKKSPEIGALFGLNEATVRGTLRLLDLPEGAQSELGQGRISLAAARMLLTYRRLTLNDEPVKKAADDLARAGEDVSAADYLEDLARRLKNTSIFLVSHEPGAKLRAGNSGWPLDMKNFPNWNLPALQIGDFMAWLGEYATTEILKIANLTAREEAGNVIAFEHALRDAGYESLVERVQLLIEPPACTACPFYARLNGRHFCGMSLCEQRKRLAWNRYQAEQASSRLKIPFYTQEDGKFLKLDHFTKSHDDAFQQSDPDLRLVMPDDIEDSYQYGFTGLDDDYAIVVAVGELRKELEQQAKEKRKQQKLGLNGGDNRASFLRDQKERSQWACAEEFGQQLFAHLPDRVLRALAGNLAYVPGWVKKTHESARDLDIQKIGMDCINQMTPYRMYDAPSVVAQMEYLEQAAREAQVDLSPRMREHAKSLDFEVDARYGVSAETVADDDDEANYD